MAGIGQSSLSALGARSLPSMKYGLYDTFCDTFRDWTLPLSKNLQRYPARAAIESLATRFGFPNHPNMQDWEWQVADPSRLDEFVAAYESGELSDDERFTLMETILQSFEELPTALDPDARWNRILGILDRNVTLHACTVWYWSTMDAEDPDNPAQQFRVTMDIRSVLEKHKAVLECQRQQEMKK